MASSRENKYKKDAQIMNFFEKLKLAAGIPLEKKDQKIEESYCEIMDNDTNDVIFAKTLIQNNGNFFYCEKRTELIKTLTALKDKLNIQTLYCIEPVLKDLLQNASIDYNSDTYTECDAILSSCEYLIAQQAKVMLSSNQLGSNNIKNLPKEHIIIAYTSQIVKSLNEGMSGINVRHIDNLPSTITTIKSKKNKETDNNNAGNIKKISVLLIEDFRDAKPK